MRTVRAVALFIAGLASLAYGQAQNFNGGGTSLLPAKVANLASYASLGRGVTVSVSDGNSSSDCSSGGGTTAVVCQYNGSSWAAVAGSGGAVSSITGDGGSNIGIHCNSASTGPVTLGLCSTFQLPTGAVVATSPAASDNSTKVDTTAARTTAINNAIAGVNPAVSVLVATIQASDTSGLTYSNGVAGIGATFTGAINTALTIDGVTFTALNQRLLVKNDTQAPSGAFNGVYYVTQVQTGILPPILTRALDYDAPSDINNTGAIPVQSGTVNASTSWLLTSTVNTVGTDALTYAQFSVSPVGIGIWNTQNNNATTPTGTQFWPINGGSGAPSAVNANVQSTMPRAGTVDRLYVVLSAAEGAAATLAFTVNKNTVTQSITCTVGNSATTCNDTAHSFTFVAGDSLSFQTVQSGTGTSQFVQVGIGYH